MQDEGYNAFAAETTQKKKTSAQSDYTAAVEVRSLKRRLIWSAVFTAPCFSGDGAHVRLASPLFYDHANALVWLYRSFC